MSNSPLVDYTHLSPNHSGQRTHAIDRITPHCVVGQLSVETMGAMFAQPSFDASCNYDIGSDGRVGLVVPENQRSWCSSSRENDQRAVTIECASDKVSPYAINDKVYNKLIDLMVDVCRRNGKSKLLWFGDKETTLAYEPQPEEMLMTVHRWFANKACPGDYIYDRLPQIASTVTSRLSGVSPVKQMLYRVRLAWNMPQTQTGAYYVLDNAKKECPAGYSVYDESGTAVWTNNANGTQARSLNGLSEAEKIRKVAPLYQDVARKTGLLASAGLAQFALESGYGTTDLAQNANNLHGMKCSLSGNTWPNSAWDGVSKYEKKTAEQDKYGNEYYVWADFRKYPRIEDSIADRAAYYLGAMNGSQRRYPGIENLTTAEAQIKAIKAGGYAAETAQKTEDAPGSRSAAGSVLLSAPDGLRPGKPALRPAGSAGRRPGGRDAPALRIHPLQPHRLGNAGARPNAPALPRPGRCAGHDPGGSTGLRQLGAALPPSPGELRGPGILRRQRRERTDPQRIRRAGPGHPGHRDPVFQP